MEDLKADCLAFGIPPDLLEGDDSHRIWAWHMPAVEAFLAVQDQWRTVATPGGPLYLGLDFSGVEAGLRLAGLTLTRQHWAEVRMISDGALAALNGD